jgi:hypothetical protein
MKNYIAIVGFAALAAIMLPVCEGPVGPQGKQGIQGIQGEKGEKGDPGDMGEPGEDGADGLSITWKGTLYQSPENPQLYWVYYNINEKKAYIYDGESWQILAQDGETGPQGPKGEIGEKGDSLYLVTFNANGGAFSGGKEIKKESAEEDCPIAEPEEPRSALGNFMGWYTQPAEGSKFNFTTPITAPITLYAQWNFNNESLAEWIMNQNGGESEENPLVLQVKINLDDWAELLDAVEAAQKYVDLDLSLCAMSGTVFNPDSGISAGKNKIVSIVLPDNATEIAAGKSADTSAFKGFVNLRSFRGANLAIIGAYAFYGCARLNQDALPSRVKSIGNYSFYKCTEMALEELPYGIISIGSHAFDGCSKLALTELPDGLTKISTYSFRNCKNLALTALPQGITEIGTYAFSGCANLALTCLPETVTSIGTNTFYNCSSLEKMTMHERITNIGNNAFSGCGSLKFFICLAETPPTLGTGVFNKISNLVITVPAASLEAYKKAGNWSDIKDKIIEID